MEYFYSRSSSCETLPAIRRDRAYSPTTSVKVSHLDECLSTFSRACESSEICLVRRNRKAATTANDITHRACLQLSTTEAQVSLLYFFPISMRTYIYIYIYTHTYIFRTVSCVVFSRVAAFIQFISISAGMC